MQKTTVTCDRCGHDGVAKLSVEAFRKQARTIDLCQGCIEEVLTALRRKTDMDGWVAFLRSWQNEITPKTEHERHMDSYDATMRLHPLPFSPYQR